MSSFRLKGRKLLLLVIIASAALGLGGITWRLVPASAEVPESDDDCWEAEYFTYYPPQGMDSRFGKTQQIKPALVRKDKEINFDWGFGSPEKVIPTDRFSARWTRTVSFPEGIYRFRIKSDDGARLYIDDYLKMDRWVNSLGVEQVVDVKLSKGNHRLKVEYFENLGTASIVVGWEPSLANGEAVDGVKTLLGTGAIQQPSSIASYARASWTEGQLSQSASPDGEAIALPAWNDILANGGFEEDADMDGLPDKWNISIPDGEFGIATGIAGNPEGRNVAIFKPSMKTFMVFQDINASPRQNYEFTGFINITNSTGWFRLSVALIPLNEQGQPLASFELASYTQPTSGWVQLSRKIVTPSYTTKLRVQAKVDVMRATAYLDDFKLKAFSP